MSNSLYQRITVTPSVNNIIAASTNPVMYTGFSTQNPTGGFTLYDVDLIKQDIANYFSIRKGSKLMNPDFGTMIWDLLFEPFTENIKSLISADVETVLNSDPRIRASNLVITPDYETGAITIEFDIALIQSTVSATMKITFDQSGQLTSPLNL